MTNAELIGKLDGKQLLTVYNAFATSKVDRFADKKTAERRVSTLLEMRQVKVEDVQKVLGQAQTDAEDVKSTPATEDKPKKEAPADPDKDQRRADIKRVAAADKAKRKQAKEEKAAPKPKPEPAPKAAAPAKKEATAPPPKKEEAKAPSITTDGKAMLRLLAKGKVNLYDLSEPLDKTPAELSSMAKELHTLGFATETDGDDVLTATDAGIEFAKSNGLLKRVRGTAPADGAEPKKQNTPPHLNLRCAKCGYYAKSTPAMLAIARLKCPVDNSILQTKEERGETRGK